MEERTLVIGAVVVGGLLVIAVGMAVYTGVGPAPGGGDSAQPVPAFPTETASAGNPDEPGTVDSPPFAFVVETIEPCGLTCRDVTVTLTNNRSEPATGVTVFTRLFAGENNTDDADLVWEGMEEVGSLTAGESYTTTKRVELSFQEAHTIDQRGGWVTILTTVQSDEHTVTYLDSEQVS